MNLITTAYLCRGETRLLMTTLFYFLMNGAQLFETAVIVPKLFLPPLIPNTRLKATFFRQLIIC